MLYFLERLDIKFPLPAKPVPFSIFSSNHLPSTIPLSYLVGVYEDSVDKLSLPESAFVVVRICVK